MQADVLPTWKQHKPPTAPKAVNTDTLQLLDAEAQTKDRSDAASQTASGSRGQSASPKAAADALAEFLLHVEPIMTAELLANESSTSRITGAGMRLQNRQVRSLSMLNHSAAEVAQQSHTALQALQHSC